MAVLICGIRAVRFFLQGMYGGRAGRVYGGIDMGHSWRIAALCFALGAGLDLCAAEYFVCQKTGDDRNAGTKDAPFKTIQAAADVAKAGDIVTVGDGVYREMVDPKNGGKSASKRIVYRAAEGAAPSIRGSGAVGGWERQRNGLWKLRIPDSFFAGHNPFKTLVGGDWFDPKGRAHHTGDVYLNGKSLYEKESVEKLLNPEIEVNPSDREGSKLRWYTEADGDNTVIYANFGGADPNAELVEISARFSCFYPSREGVDYITISGFDISQAATQWGAPTAHQVGMVAANWNRGWIIENNRIHDTKCSGITLGRDYVSGHNTWSENPAKDGLLHYIEATFRALERGWSREKVGSHTVRGNEIYNCEQTAMCGSFGAAFSLIEGNYIHDIWTKRQFGGAEMAGIKFHAPIDTVIRGNRVKNCGRGIWLDWMAQGTRVTQNLVYGNDTDDIHIEVSHGPFIIDDNLFLSRVGIYVFSGGGAYVNNTLAGMLRHVFDGRYTPYHYGHSTRIKGVAACINDSQFYNNLFMPGHPHGETPGLETYGLWYYDGRPPVFAAGGNAYVGKARPWEGEKDCVRKPDFDPKLEIADEGGEVYLVFDAPEGLKNPKFEPFTSARLNVPRVSEEPFEDAQGRAIVFDTDYLGAKRAPSNVGTGALADIKAGGNRIKVWPRK